MCAADAAGRVPLPPALPEGKATSLDRGRQEVRRIERSAEKILEAGGSRPSPTSKWKIENRKWTMENGE